MKHEKEVTAITLLEIKASEKQYLPGRKMHVGWGLWGTENFKYNHRFLKKLPISHTVNKPERIRNEWGRRM